MNTSSKSAMTFGQALKTAFEKFPKMNGEMVA